MQLGAQGTFPAVAHVIICHMPKQCVDHGCLQDGCICQSASQLAELFRVLSASNSVCTASVEAASSCSPLASNSRLAKFVCSNGCRQQIFILIHVCLQEACQ